VLAPLDKSVVRTGAFPTSSPRLEINHLPASHSLPIPSRDEIMASPMVEHHGATSGFTHQYNQRAPSPIMDDPGAELERELAGAHSRR
jgi:hypothetical protein